MLLVIILIFIVEVDANLNCVLLNELSNHDLLNVDSLNRQPLSNSNISNLTHPINAENFTVIPLSLWEMDPMFSKCGILPAELVNNNRSNAKFFIHWLFNSHNSFKLSFRLE